MRKKWNFILMEKNAITNKTNYTFSDKSHFISFFTSGVGVGPPLSLVLFILIDIISSSDSNRCFKRMYYPTQF